MVLTQCYNCKYYNDCKEVLIRDNCPHYISKPSLTEEGKYKYNTFITICHWCKKDIEISNWPERVSEFKKVSSIGGYNKPPKYLCEKCYDQASLHSSNFWYKYICADEGDNRFSWNEHNTAYTPRVTELDKLKALVYKYAEGTESTNAIVKYEGI